jgi:hypothetical protein
VLIFKQNELKNRNSLKSTKKTSLLKVKRLSGKATSLIPHKKLVCFFKVILGQNLGALGSKWDMLELMVHVK